MSDEALLLERLTGIRRRIAAACDRAGRDPASVALMAVSKGHPASAVSTLAGIGQTLFGESKVQEAKAKIPGCPAVARWHMIGHLQTNKARDAVRLFSMIQSVDSLRLAQEIDAAAEKAAKTMPILLEVNVAGESSKFGYSPEKVLAEFMAINALRRLEIHGLMTIAPWGPATEKARAVFRRLAELRRRCEGVLGAPLPVLSMGMSGDFETAIEEGATLVRVGTSLFGERVYTRTGGVDEDP
ncbi:MAG: YggS family pyridoxal phosphate-dependent enzyme [Verrucomicrobia bacterium]|nr:YggS family pyridoxal phosphate-dependent enzyme [Verrucomicrobiota bacterium]